MTLADLLPIRLGIFDQAARKPKHRAIDEVQRLTLKLEWADLLIKAQRVQIGDTESKLAASGIRQAELEERIVRQQAAIDDLTAERDHLAEEVAALKRRFAAQLAADANATRVTVPPMVRDTTAIEDQATGPIPVHTLWAALGIRPVTDPGRIQ